LAQNVGLGRDLVWTTAPPRNGLLAWIFWEDYSLVGPFSGRVNCVDAPSFSDAARLIDAAGQDRGLKLIVFWQRDFFQSLFRRPAFPLIGAQ